MTLEPLFSTASSTWPEGNDFFETVQESSFAVTWIEPLPPLEAFESLLSAQPVTAVRAASAVAAVTTERRTGRMRNSTMAGRSRWHKQVRQT